jgi:DNA recombination protein RmuC
VGSSAILLALVSVAVFFVGLWLGLRQGRAQSEAQLEQLRANEARQASELVALRSNLDRVQAESAARAGFESLAAERDKQIGQLAADRDRLREDLDAKTAVERNLAARVKELEAELRSERENLPEKLALLQAAEKTLANHFQTLAGDILEKKSTAFSETNKTELGTLINPLREQLRDFREKVEKAERENLVGRTELKSELKNLRDLNDQLSAEAHALANALTRDTSEQGHWGELVLLDILEDCGLKRGLHYTYQQTFDVDGEDGLREERRRTDVVMRFPEGRSLVIDSKVTLTAHKDYVAATDEATRQKALDAMLDSIRRHMQGLASKNYQELLGERSPDYVVLFAPIEAAYLLAVQRDPKLITDGYKKRVLIAGPTTILHIAKIVDDLWRNEDRAKSLKQIGHRARLLFEEFTRFVDELEKMRTAILRAGVEIRNAEESHNDAIKRLTSGRGNLVSQADLLGKLGEKSAKRIAPRVLEMAEEDELESDLLLADGEEANEQ